MEKRIQAKARVQMTVEVDAGAPWGAECTIEQMYKQAADSARTNLINALKPGEHGRVSIVGEPKIIGILTEAT